MDVNDRLDRVSLSKFIIQMNNNVCYGILSMP
jgi:hypothetical protein